MLVPEIELMDVHSHTSKTGNTEKKSDQDAQHSYGDNSAGDRYAISAWHDLFLLENQLPFFVIETIYDLVVSNGSVKVKVTETIVDCVEDILRQFPKAHCAAFDFCSNYCLKSLCWVLGCHYLNRWMAWLRQNHLSNPWLVLALFSAVIVLVCTVIQTIFTVLAYVRPPVQ
ncbi:hypothetical protein BAE44_0009280 [Dichanthelium oligosanthes]|uniref:Uncharacterized protein n=1 Tax=Dichanthelium oligosanthes TaxID=888268 RepID=A0A1E5VX63_9POAL|nr:hypothetical protein BAE44_0009280 [Dichanthelium oligosanthes]